MEPIQGNIRSFWYISVKPVLSRLGLKVTGPRYTQKVYDSFVELTTVHRLFRYADIGFSDHRRPFRRIGSKEHGNLVLVIEKDGLWPIVEDLVVQRRITGISLEGFPSYLTTEFMIREMAKVGLLRKPVDLFTVVDYDPGGYWIEKEFIEQLKAYGVEIGKVQSLVKPGLLPKDRLELYKYRLSSSARAANWLEATGGIAGEAYGLEADALGGTGIRKVCEKALEPYFQESRARARRVPRARLTATPKISSEREAWLAWLKVDLAWQELDGSAGTPAG